MRLLFTLFIVFLMVNSSALADNYVAAKTLKKGDVLSEDDLAVFRTDGKTPREALSDYIGYEVRRVIYKGSAVRLADIGPATVIKRNDVVVMLLRYRRMHIATKGRALDPGGIGEKIRIMNLDSRKIVNGAVTGAGEVEVVQ